MIHGMQRNSRKGRDPETVSDDVCIICNHGRRLEDLVIFYGLNNSITILQVLWLWNILSVSFPLFSMSNL